MVVLCQWKVGGEKQCNGRHQKPKGNIWRVMFANVFSPFPQKCMLLFQMHAGNGSSVCQRLTLQRGSGEAQADTQRSFKWGRIKWRRQRNTKSGFEKASSRPLPSYTACHINYACLYQSEMIKSFKTNKATSVVRLNDSKHRNIHKAILTRVRCINMKSVASASHQSSKKTTSN